MRSAKGDELAFICWGIATGLMIARDTYDRANDLSRPTRNR